MNKDKLSIEAKTNKEGARQTKRQEGDRHTDRKIRSIRQTNKQSERWIIKFSVQIPKNEFWA